MINSLLLISIAPVLLIAFYINFRDKYEKEPPSVLLKALFAGVLIVLPVVIIEYILSLFSRNLGGLAEAAYTAFIVAAFTEEGMKYLAFYIFFWKNRNFNEKFDGIVYAVFIALGFAAVENILYVITGGFGVGILRALTAVPAHALFGIMMGYYFGLARFSVEHRPVYLVLAFILPYISHGLYDFMLMGKIELLLVAFIPAFIYFWINGFQKISKLSDASIFKTGISGDRDNPEDKNV